MICTMYNAKTPFLSFQASHFGIENQFKKNMCFANPLLGGRFFLIIWSICFKNYRCWDPFKIRGHQNGTINLFVFEILVEKIDAQRFRDRLEKRKYMQKRQAD